MFKMKTVHRNGGSLWNLMGWILLLPKILQCVETLCPHDTYIAQIRIGNQHVQLKKLFCNISGY